MTREIPKKPYDELKRTQEECGIRYGQVYRHHSGTEYLVVGLAFDCKTNDLRVQYTPIVAGAVVFSRPASDFTEPRFTRLT